MRQVAPNYVVRWRESSISKNFRFIKPDGFFFCETVDYANMRVQGFEGSLSPDDYNTLASLVESIKSHPLHTHPDTARWAGVVQEGYMGGPGFLFRFYVHDAPSRADLDFKAIVSILAKYVGADPDPFAPNP